MRKKAITDALAEARIVAEKEATITRRLLMHKQNKFFEAQKQMNQEALE
jgi:hypothetical protein